MADTQYIAKTLSGLEDVLAKELQALKAKNIHILKRAVGFEGNKSLLYKSNYCCRTAVKILQPIQKFEVSSEEELYDQVKNMDWQAYIGIDNTFAIDAVLSHSNLTHSHYVSLKAKDAIADFFYEKKGKRPSVDIQSPDLGINIHIHKNQCTLSLDSSWTSLHKRGYRQVTGLAPINEALAAGLIYLSGWDKTSPLLDPFCGSGTLLAEAAMMALGIPAGYYRTSFGFEKWRDFNSGLWEDIRATENAKITDRDVPIFGSDISAPAIENAKANLRRAKLHKDIIVLQSSFEKLKPPYYRGTIITNPPYGERIKKRDMIEFYQMIGNTLKNKYAGYNAWMIASDLGSVKFVGLKPSAKYDVFNGKLPCKFLKFELYEGSRKQKHN